MPKPPLSPKPKTLNPTNFGLSLASELGYAVQACYNAHCFSTFARISQLDPPRKPMMSCIPSLRA